MKIAEPFKAGIINYILDLSPLQRARDEIPRGAACYTSLTMSQALPLPPPGFEALSVNEQIDYLQSLWDQIAAKPEEVPVPDWHREVLAERLTSYRANEDGGKLWEEAESDLIADLKRTS